MYVIGPDPDELRADARECDWKALEAAFDDEQEVADGYVELAEELRWEADEAEFYEAQVYADCRFPALVERAEGRDGWDDEDDDPNDDVELHLALEREQERIRLSQGLDEDWID